MLFVVDVGNTNTVFAVFQGTRKRSEWRCSTNNLRTADEYFVWLKSLMELSKIDFGAINSVIISSVVPQVVFNLRVLASRYFSCRPIVVGKSDCLIPIDIRVDPGTMVGADRIVNSVGAFNRYGGNLVVVDFGTATTFDIVDYDGAYIGGIIAPGVNLSMKALHDEAAALPYIDISKPKDIIGTNTVECMQSGIFWGYLSLIEGLIDKIQKKRETKIQVIATGGLATLFSLDTSVFDKVDLDLTLAGLVDIYNFNLKEK
jgi:type III pantothenate kinase